MTLLFIMFSGALSVYALELPQRHTYQLSCLFIPDAGEINLELHPHPEDPEKIEIRADVTFGGFASILSGARAQHYISTVVMGSATNITGIHHRQEVELNHAGKRISYAWEWRRNAEKDTFAARRFWGGEQKQLCNLEGEGDVVSDILSLIFRIGADVSTNQHYPQEHEYTLLDPEGNIQVHACFNAAKRAATSCTHVRLNFSRNPLTLGTSMLELWFNPVGEILYGRIPNIGGLLHLHFTPVK